jgi:hypothetical protein
MITLENYTKLMFEDNKHHLDALLKIVTETHADPNQPGLLEGNCMYDNCTTNINPAFYNKQINIFNLAKNANIAVEAGVNAGHSLLLMLLANPITKIYGFDICFHTYTEPCVAYLNSQFDNRIILIKGNSKITMPEFIQNNPDLQANFFHIDGMHEPDTDHDFQNSYKLAAKDAVMIWDDSDNHILNGLWQNYIRENKVIDISNEYSNTTLASNGHHAIGKIIK